jgi:hypothetical protein
MKNVKLREYIYESLFMLAAFVYQAELNSKFIKAIKREDMSNFQIKEFAFKLLKIKQMRLPYNYFN